MKMAIPARFELRACTRCAWCHEPLELLWTASCAGHNVYHGACWYEMYEATQGQDS